MAFVHRTERIINIAPKSSSDLGPGQYISATNFTKYLHPNKIPFLVNTKREDIGGRSKTPGVGSYNIDANNRMKLELQSRKKKFLDYRPSLVENLNIVNAKEIMGKKNGFLSNTARFIDAKNSLNPGPGSYIKEIQPKPIVDQKHMEDLMQKKNPNFKPLAGSNCRILSIPNKNQGYGYEIVDDKMVMLNDDPDADTKYDGIDNCVGPGKYEIEKPKVWHKKGTSWSKSQVERMDNNSSRKGPKDKNKSKPISIKELRKSMDDEQSTFYKSEIEKDFSKTSQGFYSKEKVYKHIKMKEELNKMTVKEAKIKKLEGINQMIYEVITYLTSLGNSWAWILF